MKESGVRRGIQGHGGHCAGRDGCEPVMTALVSLTSFYHIRRLSPTVKKGLNLDQDE